MPPKICFGVNLNFAKFVYGPKRAMEIVRDKFGLRRVEAVPDIDFGPVFYLQSPESYRNHHWDIADHASRLGMKIESVLTFYRDMGAIAHPNATIRESAYRIGLAMHEMASCYKARYSSASPFTMNREFAEDPERFQSLFDASVRVWKRWMEDASRLHLEKLLLETSSTYREGCSTLEDSQVMLDILDKHHDENPGTTVPVGLCYDTGHGISEIESPIAGDRDFRCWFDAFRDRIHEIHLKDTDPLFQETFHFGEERGIIDPDEIVVAIRDRLTVPDVLLFIEVPGKRGREIGERVNIEGHQRTISIFREAFQRAGYREIEEESAWVAD